MARHGLTPGQRVDGNAVKAGAKARQLAQVPPVLRAAAHGGMAQMDGRRAQRAFGQHMDQAAHIGHADFRSLGHEGLGGQA
ncbi:hypothetical protein SDC9_152158 [bioreactor metagenome]|uniref:Uncharacterized protein n=1 Tax=bioreactor metagenome TaxID=1076179 RepID=A0A645EU02_9ZZZZ